VNRSIGDPFPLVRRQPDQTGQQKGRRANAGPSRFAD
jgi:hypothetical protein